MKRPLDKIIFRNYFKYLIKPGMLALLSLGFLPGSVYAQLLECNPDLNAAALGGPLFFINEPITISVDLGAGNVSGGTGDPKDYLDIDSFDYQLDCTEGDTFPNCTQAGNTVEFVAGSIVTDCVDSAGNPASFNATVANGEVTFTPSSGLPIRNFSNQACNVSFDLIVTGLSGGNLEKEIVELTGWSSADAQCDNGLTASAASSVRFDLSTTVTIFRVTKDFSDGNPGKVEVHISCNTGLPLEQDFMISEVGNGVGFVVKYHEAGTLNCDVWEEPVPPGYTESYTAGSITGVGDFSDDANGCHFTNVVNGEFTCEVVNEVEETKVTVLKEWIFHDESTPDIPSIARAVWSCHNVRSNPYGNPEQRSGVMVFEGNSSNEITGLYPDFDGTSYCEVEEISVDSAVEPDFEDCLNVPVELGRNNHCTIYNTVFFEGVPSLNQYGLALLALLMLGVGLLGFRRFA